MNAEELVSDFGKRIGVELALDDNACAFEADGLAVMINYFQELEAFVLTGDLGEPPPEHLEGLFKMLLVANHLFTGTAGATLALNQDTGRVSICRTLPLALLDGNSFYAQVERFVNMSETWIRLVFDYRGAAASAPAEEDSHAFVGNGFMQV